MYNNIQTFYLRIGAAAARRVDSRARHSRSGDFGRSQDDVIRNQDSIYGILSGLAPRCHTVEIVLPARTCRRGRSAYPYAGGYSWTPYTIYSKPLICHKVIS